MLRVFNDTARCVRVGGLLSRRPEAAGRPLDANQRRGWRVGQSRPSCSLLCCALLCRYVDQGGGKRKGAFAIYMEPWHSDVFEFLELRKNTGRWRRGRGLAEQAGAVGVFVQALKPLNPAILRNAPRRRQGGGPRP